MQCPATTLLFLVLFLQSSSGYMTRGNFPSSDERSLSRDFDRSVGVLPTGTRNSIWSLLSLEDGSVQARTRQSVHNLAIPVISIYDLHTVRELKENVGNNVEGETDHEIVELLTGDGNFNNVPSMNSYKINKRQLPILGKGVENPTIRATEDWIKHYSVHHGHTLVRGSQRPEINNGHVKEAEYSEETKENKREPSLLRLGKRQLSMLRLGKRQLPMVRLGKRQLRMLRLGKRQLPMLRPGKRQLPMLRLGKRQLPMLRLGKRQLPMLRLSKSLNYEDGETEKLILDNLSFDIPEL